MSKNLWSAYLDKLVKKGEYPEEVLDPYCQALSARARDWWLHEEQVCRDTFLFATLSDPTFHALSTPSTNPTLREPIHGAFSYDILNNIKYEEAF